MPKKTHPISELEARMDPKVLARAKRMAQKESLNIRIACHDFLLYDRGMDQVIKNQIDILKNIIVQTVPVERIYLFGSYAYGTPTPDSDLDLYVIMKDDAPLPALEAEQKIALASIGHKKMAADILVLTKSRFQRRLTAPTLEREVSKKGIVIYG